MGDTENTFWKDGEIRFLDNTPEPRAALFIQQPIKMLLLRKRSEDQDHLFLSIFHCSGSFSAFRTWTLGPAIKVLFETFSALILLFSAICTALSTLWSTDWWTDRWTAWLTAWSTARSRDLWLLLLKSKYIFWNYLMWNISFLPQTKLVDTGAWYRDKFRNFLYKNHISSGRFRVLVQTDKM